LKFKNEDEAKEHLADFVKNNNSLWRMKTEVPIGSLIADARIDEVNENEIVQRTVSYVEIKISEDLRDLLTGYTQALYYAEQSGAESWLATTAAAINKVLSSGKTLDSRVRFFDLDTNTLKDSVSIIETMTKTKRKRKTEETLYKMWTQEYVIQTITPIGIKNLNLDGENILFNIGSRARACIREFLKTKQPSLGDAVKFGIYVEPFEIVIAKKSELKYTEKFVPRQMGTSIKSGLYEIPPPRKIQFILRCMSPKLTPEIITEALRQAGRFTGLGDSHTDGFHGRFNVIAIK